MANQKKRKRVARDTPENRKWQKEIISRADYSLALWGMAFVRHGSGRFLNLRANSKARA